MAFISMWRKHRKTVCAIAMLCGVVSSANADGLQAQMDKLFDEMRHTTPPGVYESQRRGVMAGGRFTTKTRIFDENLVSMIPPSWKAGCGGVDLFGGSLSFINTDQLVQLLRSIAANAKGYAFQLALDNVFPDGAKWIENFQKKVQALNQHLGNSCQLAQGVVNDMTSGFDLKFKTDASLKGTVGGLFEDFFSSRQETNGQSPPEKMREQKPDDYQKLIGNIVWKQLKKNQAQMWFQGGDDALLEAIMSLTGTVIIGDLVDDPAQANAKTTPLITLPGNKISLADLIEGGSLRVYSCANDLENCLLAGTESGMRLVELKGIRSQISDVLLGTSATPGVIFKYATNIGTLTDQEKAFAANLPEGIGTIVRNLSVLSKDAANIFAAESSGALALHMVYSFAEELLRATRIALANSDSPYQKTALELLAQSQNQIRKEYALLLAQYGDLATQISKYNNLLENIRKQKYLLTTLSKAPKTKE